MGRKGRARRADDEPVGGGDHLGDPLAAAEIETVVIVDVRPAGDLARIDEARLVAHLRPAGEPPLAERVAEGPRLDPWRTGRPEAHPRVLAQRPRVALAVVGRVAARDRTVDLHPPRLDRQPVARGDQRRGGAVDVDGHTRLAHRLAQRIPVFFKRDQLHARPPAPRPLGLAGLAQIEIERAQGDGNRRVFGCRRRGNSVRHHAHDGGDQGSTACCPCGFHGLFASRKNSSTFGAPLSQPSDARNSSVRRRVSRNGSAGPLR